MTILIFILCTLILMLVIDIYISKTVLTASNFLITIFIVGTIFSIIGNFTWNERISPNLYIIVICSILVFNIGELLLFRKKLPLEENVVLRHGHLMWILLFSVVSLGLNIKMIIDILILNGYSFDMGNILGFLRIYMVSGDEYSNYLANLFVMFSYGTGYLSIYYLIKNKNRKSILIHMLIILIMIINIILSTNRSTLILVSIYTIVLLLENTGKIKIKHLMYLVGVGFITISVSLFLGSERSFVEFNSFKSLVHYAGSSMIALNRFLTSDFDRNLIFGEETFVGIRMLLNRFFENVHPGVIHKEFIFLIDGSSSNIYTAFRSYIKDFGYIANFVIMFISGFIFGLASNFKKSSLSIIIYAYFISNLSFSLFAPTLFSSLFTIREIFILLFIFLIYKTSYRSFSDDRTNTEKGGFTNERYNFSWR